MPQRAGGSSCLRTHSTWSLCARPTAQLQQLSTRPSLQCYMLLLAKKIETVTRKPNKGACMLEGSGACAAPRAHSRLHRDSDLTGSVDHTHCCTLYATAQSFVWTRSVWTCRRTTGRGTAMGLNCRKDEKTPLLSIKTQQRADTTRSRRDNKFSSHACGNTKPGWTSSFSPSSWRGQRHARRRPHLFQWRTREKVLGGTKSGCVLSAVQRQISSCEFRIKRCTVLCFRMWLQRLVVWSLLQTDFPGLYFSSPSPPTEAFCKLVSKPW